MDNFIAVSLVNIMLFMACATSTAILFMITQSAFFSRLSAEKRIVYTIIVINLTAVTYLAFKYNNELFILMTTAK